MNQWELKANTRSWRQARENACDQVAMIGLGFAWESGASFTSQALSVVKQNQSKSTITLISTLNWKPLYYHF